MSLIGGGINGCLMCPPVVTHSRSSSDYPWESDLSPPLSPRVAHLQSAEIVIFLDAQLTLLFERKFMKKTIKAMSGLSSNQALEGL